MSAVDRATDREERQLAHEALTVFALRDEVAVEGWRLRVRELDAAGLRRLLVDLALVGADAAQAYAEAAGLPTSDALGHLEARDVILASLAAETEEGGDG